MSFNISSWAWKQEGMSSTAKFVLVALADWADDSGECWPSVSSLAQKMCYSRNSRPSIRRAITELEGLGLISKRGRVRKGTSAQTSHMYRINWQTPRADDNPSEVGANNSHVGADSTRGGCSKLHEPVNEPIREPITSPTPSSLRDDGEKNPYAIDVPSTVQDFLSEDEQTTQTLRGLVRAIYDTENEGDHYEASETFIRQFENIYGTGLKDAGHRYWNDRWNDRLYEIIEDAQSNIGEQRGISYGISKWLSMFTNSH